jgi:hypothetical protein
MRRNRGAPGGSGSVGFLSRALKCREADLTEAFAALGLVLPDAGNENPAPIEIGGRLWWLNRDQRGGIWINDRQAQPAPAGAQPAAVPAPAEGGATPPAPPAAGEPAAAAPALDSVLPALRLLLRETRTGAVAGELVRLAETLGKNAEEVLSALVAIGLKVPEKPREKPVFVEQAGEVFWLNRNAKDELWLNAKPTKFGSGDGADDEAQKRSRRPRRATAAAEPPAPAPAE